MLGLTGALASTATTARDLEGSGWFDVTGSPPPGGITPWTLASDAYGYPQLAPGQPLRHNRQIDRTPLCNAEVEALGHGCRLRYWALEPPSTAIAAPVT